MTLGCAANRAPLDAADAPSMIAARVRGSCSAAPSSGLGLPRGVVVRTRINRGLLCPQRLIKPRSNLIVHRSSLSISVTGEGDLRSMLVRKHALACVLA